jgi:hypothetical protein
VHVCATQSHPPGCGIGQLAAIAAAVAGVLGRRKHPCVTSVGGPVLPVMLPSAFVLISPWLLSGSAAFVAAQHLRTLGVSIACGVEVVLAAVPLRCNLHTQPCICTHTPCTCPQWLEGPGAFGSVIAALRAHRGSCSGCCNSAVCQRDRCMPGEGDVWCDWQYWRLLQAAGGWLLWCSS